MKKYNHMFTIAFEVVTPHKGQDVTAEELLRGLEQRLSDLRENGDEILEACGLPDDTFVVQP